MLPATKILVLAAIVASSASANTLTSLLQSKLALSQETGMEIATELQAVDCSRMTDMFCPNSQPPPNVVFSVDRGIVAGSTRSCCKGNYLQCQLQTGNALCRTLATYTIVPDQGNAEDVCPPTTPECVCQQALAAEKSLRLRLCPNKPDCCPQCSCYGDPHCTAFDSTKAAAVWAVCDDRDATCTHKAETCAKTTYAGQQCQWVTHSAGYSECVRADNTPIPMMKMYSKTYKNYWDSKDNKLYDFSLVLELTSYGSVSTITLTDAGATSVFTINSAGKCVGTAKYPLNSQNFVVINGLPSGVWIQLECMNNGPKLPQRWDVRFLKDPWFTPGQIDFNPDDKFAGFCVTGKIDENTGETIGGCRIMDRQIAMYYGCKAGTPIANCKSQFCNKYGGQFKFTGLSGNAAKQCTTFVNDAKNPSNFVAAACSLSTSHSRPAYPQECRDDPECLLCMDSITDFPDQIADILGKAPVVPTRAPTTSCPPNILSIGLARKSLSQFNSGVQIDYNVNGVWTGVFAVLDEEVTACGGCENVLFVNGSIAANQPLLNPGQYRIRQCTGYNNDRNQFLCDGALGYNASVAYENPVAGGAVSATYGALFDAGDLVCSVTKFPKCPLNYQCCIWDRITQRFAWESCMDVFHGGAAGYPNCGK